MRAVVALIIVAALVFIAFGTYFTFLQQRKAEELRQMTVVTRRAQAAEVAKVLAQSNTKAAMPTARYEHSQRTHGLLAPAPLAVDASLGEFGARYAAMSESERQATRAALDGREQLTLLHFARRAAVFSLRETSAQRCTEGLTALAMLTLGGADRQDGLDPRDVLVAIGLLDHACRKLGTDITTQVELAALLAATDVATLLRDYTKREPSTRGLAAWGYAEIEIDGEVGLIPTGTAKYQPARDLGTIGVAVAASLDATRWTAVGVTIAESLPPIWFAAGDQTQVAEHLARVRGTVMIRATPTGTSQPDNYQFVVFLSEATNAAACDWLTRAVRGTVGGGFAATTRAEELFCLVVSRSVVANGEPLHSAAQVQSFADDIDTVLQAQLAKRK